MITTDAALYADRTTSVLGGALLTSTVASTCGCGQELFDGGRRHCPRCGCCLA